MAAIYFNVKKNRGLLHKLTLDVKNLKSIHSGFKSKAVKDDWESGLNLNYNNSVETNIISKFTAHDNLDPKHLWKKMITKSDEKTHIEKVRASVKVVESLNAFFSLLCIVLSIIDYETSYFPTYYPSNNSKNSNSHNISNSNIGNSNNINNHVRIILLCLSIILIILSYISCKLCYFIKYEKKKTHEKNFFKTHYFNRFLIETLINIIHPIPFIDDEFNFNLLGKTIKYRAMTFLYAFELFKFYNLFRLFAVYSEFSNDLAENLCHTYGCEASIFFAIKCELKDKPLKMLLYCLLNIGIMLGILVRIFEVLDPRNRDYFSDFTNGIWMIFITFTTVGYGEFFIRTHFGRLVVVCAILLGTFIISVTIVSFTSLSLFSNAETNAFKILIRYRIKKELRDYAGKIISCYVVQRKTDKEIARIEENLIKNKENLIKSDKNEENYYLKLLATSSRLKRQRKIIRKLLDYSKQFILKDSFNNEDEQFIDLENKIDHALRMIKVTLKYLHEYRDVFHKQLNCQLRLLSSQVKVVRMVRLLRLRFYSLLLVIPKYNNNDKDDYNNKDKDNNDDSLYYIDKEGKISVESNALKDGNSNRNYRSFNKQSSKTSNVNPNNNNNNNNVNTKTIDIPSPYSDLSNREILNSFNNYDYNRNVPTSKLIPIHERVKSSISKIDNNNNNNNIESLTESEQINIMKNCFTSEYSASILLSKLNQKKFNYNLLFISNDNKNNRIDNKLNDNFTSREFREFIVEKLKSASISKENQYELDSETKYYDWLDNKSKSVVKSVSEKTQVYLNALIKKIKVIEENIQDEQ